MSQIINYSDEINIKAVNGVALDKTNSTTTATASDTNGQPPAKISKRDAQFDADIEMIESGAEVAVVKKEVVLDEDDISTQIASINIQRNEPKTRQNLKWNLRVIISNLYMQSERRLPTARVPRCLHNTGQCVSRHRCGMLPDAPTIENAQNLRSHLNNEFYDTYLDMLEIMAIQSVFPDEAVFDRLFDLIMILTTKCLSMEELKSRYINVLRIFNVLVDAFPPCWTALRPYYLNFLGVNNPTDGKTQKLQLLLDLLEDCMSKCSDAELKEETKFYEDFVHNNDEEDKMGADEAFLHHMQGFDWQNGRSDNNFKKMSPSVRLARLSNTLNMICCVLEREFLAWLDHNRLQQAEPEIFQEETKPFVFLVFGITPKTRLTKLTRQLFRLYSRAASKSMYPARLRILERFISLIMEASNTAELQYEDGFVMYPSLGPQTRRLIGDFFKIFKLENPADVTTYIRTIPQLSQSYMRFEFADQFLQLFYSSNEEFSPEKVCEEQKAKRWLKYKPRSDIDEADNEQLSREDYLKIMLNALQDYCLWLDLQACWDYIKTKTPVQQLQTRTNSPLATPVGVVTGDVGKIFMLDKMQKEAHTWKDRINLDVNLAKPKVNLPVARINVSKMAERYGNDLRHLRYLRRLLLEAMRFENVQNWLDYLNGFLGEDEPSASSVS